MSGLTESLQREFKYRLVLYFIFIISSIIGSYYAKLEASLTIIVTILSSATEISYRLSSSTSDISESISKSMNRIDKKIDQIKEKSSLLSDGTAWYEGARMIDGLEKGEMILASNLVSWVKDKVKDYITANKNALERGVIIKRLYANTIDNQKLAKDQLQWVKGVESEQHFERKMYDREQPMLDYILAIDKNNLPKWAVLWIYSPDWASSIVHGFIIKDNNILEGLHKDFKTKWTNPEFTTTIPTT